MTKKEEGGFKGKGAQDNIVRRCCILPMHERRMET